MTSDWKTGTPGNRREAISTAWPEMSQPVQE